MNPLDQAILSVDNALRTLSGHSRGSGRPNPAANSADALLRPWERRRAARMMRVNHAGEVMAQALYTGQEMGTDDPELAKVLRKARAEEEDHLRWCEERLDELHGRPSLLGPLWYATAWGMGFLAARRGRGSNLGLVVAVENLVEEHLKEHLQNLPVSDERSRRILEQMEADERGHAEKAESLGAVDLPTPVRVAMQSLSRIVTRGALWV
ncbi:2-polyprenyl-3-methyl-6-methoxy-1,4-benzoquinone monooxygenase [Candidatus Igneacidithiobacillus taiwanensis]|uniref:2-polyprenyl-3-methyl-6-methoxy-1,4-benzoquinone monooxygenase n=1 Tax=Candidatus Igneacidithiobacillus taiwanensis TaxID=1945924 RepID=UPI002896D474|nr:2-polyprenyl-3-methyl-6-methoxy-1,4-benzoquinone monooxygenase [Candidatus Igneacidithiobacillus taiwanensis]